MPSVTRETLERLYLSYNRREFVNPDPLMFLYHFPQVTDREIAGLIAATFAYGNVKQILKTVEGILRPMGNAPRDYILHATGREWKKTFNSFVHRWHRFNDLRALFLGIRQVILKHGDLESCFLKGGLSYLAESLTLSDGEAKKNLLPHPLAGSACKRWHMYLRWMVRHDEVDPGGWERISPQSLYVPLDTHMHQMALHLGLTERTQANFKTVEEITKAFAKFCPEDPVRYDFVLTRFGIRGGIRWPDV